nr:MAG TPA: hypothetical protein [Caudoviricetes sp.]
MPEIKKHPPSYIIEFHPIPTKKKGPSLNEYPPRKTRPEWSSPSRL